MRLLDLFCGAGGAGMGYHQAGFEVIGVDINPQPRYPFEFHQADALEYVREHGHEFDVIHASPPCQKFSKSVSKKHRKNHVDLIGKTRQALEDTGLPYIIENVRQAKLNANLMLCGSMFGLRIERHRYFELSFSPPLTAPCDHFAHPQDLPCAYNRTNGLRVYAISGGWQHVPHEENQEAMEIDWMNPKELSEAIPPVYTKFIGEKIMNMLDAESIHKP